MAALMDLAGSPTLPRDVIRPRAGVGGAAPAPMQGADPEVEPAPDVEQRLHARLVAAQEAERARIARDLHDVVGQALTAVRLNLMALDRLDARTGASGAEIIDCIAVVDAALSQVRTAAFELRPAVLDDLGIGAALRALCREVARRTGLAISCRISIGGDRLAPEIETTCYRVAQEALTNVVRHAGARHVSVQLAMRGRPRIPVLEVVDDGVGFDPAGRAGAATLGICGMAERVALVGGALEVRSTHGTGTQVVARLGTASRGATVR